MIQPASVVVDIGGVAVRFTSTDARFPGLLEERYGKFLSPVATPAFHFDVTIVPPGALTADADLSVHGANGHWTLERGDFRAELDVRERRGRIEQVLSSYAADSVLRIVHSLLLATEGGFLLHASSAVRNGRAFLFTGVSGAGKTTIVRLAPPDVRVLTDEISYVRRARDNEYLAFGTPFAGDLGEAGAPISAPIAAVFRLEQAADNRQEPLSAGEALRTLMRNILFFADDPVLSSRVLDAACDFIRAVPVSRLAFTADGRVWEAIR